jgi:hypothetical protein
MEGPVYLHVGMKRTGTSYLQSTLRASVEELEKQGLALVPRHEPAGARLARGLLGKSTSGDPVEALPRQLAAAPGNRCLISQELLGRADRSQIARLAPALGGRDVHVVVTVRDVARTIPSAWQQYVKAGHSYRYDEFRDAILSGQQTRATRAFWSDHGVVEMVERWGALTTASSTHVVVLPRPGAPPEVLLERYCSVIGVDPSRLARDVAKPNETLGLAQVEVLRRLNEERGTYSRKVYGKVYKREFARGVLAAQRGARPLMPAASRAWCREYTERMREALGSGGYDVIGGLGDLHPPDSAFTEQAQEVSDAALGKAALEALRAVLDLRASEVERARSSRAGTRKDT